MAVGALLRKKAEPEKIVKTEEITKSSEREVELVTVGSDAKPKLLMIVHGKEIEMSVKLIDYVYGSLCMNGCEWCNSVRARIGRKEWLGG